MPYIQDYVSALRFLWKNLKCSPSNLPLIFLFWASNLQAVILLQSDGVTTALRYIDTNVHFSLSIALIQILFFLLYLQCMWFLYGILVSIPPAYSIRCYRGECRGSHCTRFENIECSANEDRCGHLTYTTGSSVKVSKRNCESPTDCNEGLICAIARYALSRNNDSYTSCSMTCCHSDLCNAPGNVMY